MQDLAATALMALGLTALGGYLLGSVPFGVILTRAAGAGDLRTIGSGNIGATNVLRTGRKDLALATLLLDAGKGAVTLLVARYLSGSDLVAAVAGGAAFLGHLFPIWLKFRGGKGVATFFGLLLAAAWPLGVLAGAIWLLTAFLTRYSSLSALTASAAAPIIAMAPLGALGLPAAGPIQALAAVSAVLIWIRHTENIRRLANRSEPRIGAAKRAA